MVRKWLSWEFDPTLWVLAIGLVIEGGGAFLIAVGPFAVAVGPGASSVLSK